MLFHFGISGIFHFQLVPCFNLPTILSRFASKLRRLLPICSLSLNVNCPGQVFKAMFFDNLIWFLQLFLDAFFTYSDAFDIDTFQNLSISIQAQAPHKFCFAKSYFVGTQNILRKVHTFTSFQLCSQKTLWHVKSNRF